MDYCVQDVLTEMAVAERLAAFPVEESEWGLYGLDQRMNDRGVAVDSALAEAAVDLMGEVSAADLARLKAVTGLANPNSVAQLKGWLAARGVPFASLGRELVAARLAAGGLPEDVAEVLELRLRLSLTSTKKYVRMAEACCSDGRMRGLLQFYGANRTGRWAGRLLQVQNLPRNYLEDIEYARELVLARDKGLLELFYDSVPEVLKQLIRTGLVAKEGCRFLVSDFSGIEARVLAWFAGEDWVLEVFFGDGRIYEATAAQIFQLGEVSCYDWESAEGRGFRQRGKVAALALGYQGGAGALKAMGALDHGIAEAELPEIVARWREANPKIVGFWQATQRAVQDCLAHGGVRRGPRGLKFFQKGGFLFIELPSGRRLAYAKARLEAGRFGSRIVYEGQGAKGAFAKQETYGGKLVENIVQATARDILAAALVRLEAASYEVVFHVHDEVVAEVPAGVGSVAELNGLMAVAPSWAEGLPLAAEGFESGFYRKD